MQRARRARILRPGQRMIEIVGIFAPDMAEREIGEAFGEIQRQNGGRHRGALPELRAFGPRPCAARTAWTL